MTKEAQKEQKKKKGWKEKVSKGKKTGLPAPTQTAWAMCRRARALLPRFAKRNRSKAPQEGRPTILTSKKAKVGGGKKQRDPTVKESIYVRDR